MAYKCVIAGCRNEYYPGSGISFFSFILPAIAWDDDLSNQRFKPDFLFGASTLPLYVEGSVNKDVYYLNYDTTRGFRTGRDESKTWHYYDYSNKRAQEKIFGGELATINSYKAELKRLRELGVDFYRFGISWTRVMPNGDTKVINERGLQLYDNVINDLLKYNIEPVIVMHDFDVPALLHKKGSWCNPKMINWFKDYAELLINRYGDRVKKWTTINRPQACYEVCRNDSVIPNMKTGVDDYICTKNVLLAHAKVYRMYEKTFKKKFHGEIGFSLDLDWLNPDRAEKHNEKVTEIERQFRFGIFLHPIFSKYGDWPIEVKTIVDGRSREEGLSKSRLPKLTKTAINLIKGAADFLSINHYTTSLIVPDYNTSRPRGLDHSAIDKYRGEWRPTGLRWRFHVPYGIYKMCMYLNEKYDYPPIIIAENGVISPRGLNDVPRVYYYKEYLQALLYAIEDGTDVRAYSAFSLCDGVHEVGFTNSGLYELELKNIRQLIPRPRDSAFFYKKVVETHKNPMNWQRSQSQTMKFSSRRLNKKKLVDEWKEKANEKEVKSGFGDKRRTVVTEDNETAVKDKSEKKEKKDTKAQTGNEEKIKKNKENAENEKMPSKILEDDANEEQKYKYSTLNAGKKKKSYKKYNEVQLFYQYINETIGDTCGVPNMFERPKSYFLGTKSIKFCTRT